MDTKAKINLSLEMSTDETLDWLKNTVGLEEYEKPFYTNKIDGIMLAEMKDQDLIDVLGISNRLHRVKILGEIQKLLNAAKQSE